MNNYLNYAHWDQLVETDDPTKKLQQLAFEWELRSYFGLDFEQVQEMKTNWNMYNEGKYEFVRFQWPSNDTYRDQVGCAYWQWADSYMTRYKQSPEDIAPSVAAASDTVVGYVEFWYWLNYFACPAEGNGHMSDANCAFFGDVNMYRDKSDTSVNMEYLWNLADPFNEGGDPPENSLFNLDTLKELI